MRLLRIANKVLPEIKALEAKFSGMRDGSSGRLYIAIECHACFGWLSPVLEAFRHNWPKLDVDILPGIALTRCLPCKRRR